MTLSTYCLSEDWFKLAFSASFLPLYGVFSNETLMPIFKYVPVAFSFLQYALVTFALLILSDFSAKREVLITIISAAVGFFLTVDPTLMAL